MNNISDFIYEEYDHNEHEKTIADIKINRPHKRNYDVVGINHTFGSLPDPRQNEYFRPLMDEYSIPYWVSNMGYIYSSMSGKILRMDKRKDGYVIVHLQDPDYKSVPKYLHIIVAEQFVSKPDSDEALEIDHIDGNKSNNRADNLEWVTHKENMKRAMARKEAAH